MSHELPELKSATEIQQGISGLSDLIHSKADAEVAATARQLQGKVIETGARRGQTCHFADQGS